MVVGLLSAACSPPRVTHVVIAGLGEACVASPSCRSLLLCSEKTGTCEPTGEAAAGEACILSADCQPDLFCRASLCAVSGDQPVNADCAKTADCRSGLTCLAAASGGVCGSAGRADVGSSCDRAEECAAGLVCDPQSSTCLATFSPPFGADCTRDRDCAPQLGLFCQPQGKICRGVGPDGAPLPAGGWSGASCPASGRLEGEFRQLFEIPGDGGDSGQFYALPYPNDIRRRDGTLDLSGHPVLPQSVLSNNLLANAIAAIEATQTGYGPHQGVFLRFSGPPLFCAKDCGTACAPGCLGRGGGEQVLVADITRDGAGEFLSAPFTPIRYSWAASTGRQTYMCWNWLAVKPERDSWLPDHTYAVFTRTSIRNAAGEELKADEDFVAVLAAADPGGSRAAAWASYEPLRAWLATSPTYPNSSTVVLAADMAGAAVFTVRDPSLTMTALARAVEDGEDAVFTNVAVCAAGPECAGPGFLELQGDVTLRRFQSGTAPFETQGGAIDIPSTAGQTVQARFSLTLPEAEAPAAGWPVVLYAHGTGGNSRSHIQEGLAAKLSRGAPGFAVLGVTQVAHGSRKGESARSADRLFFNLVNPAAGRGNALQAAAEQLQLSRSVGALSAVLAGLSSSRGPLDSNTVLFLGHSQGALVGALAMAYAEDVGSAVLSAGGGHLLTTFNEKTSPSNIRELLKMALFDGKIDDAALHPALNIIQGYLEEADPLNYSRRLRDADVGVHKNIMLVVGVGDTYTPNAGSMTFARGSGVRFLDAAGDLTVASDPMAVLPLQANHRGKTALSIIHRPEGAADGHFVLFDQELAAERMLEFFRSHTSNGGVPLITK